MFFGRYYHTIDAKGRVSVPAEFRDWLRNERCLMLAPYEAYGEEFIEVYPWSGWEKLLRKFDELPHFSREAQRFAFWCVSKSRQCEIDSAGRILVPPDLREHAGLRKNVVFLGNVRKMGLMDGERLARVDEKIKSEAAAGQVALFQDLGL